jgi:hypothetical protein
VTAHSKQCRPTAAINSKLNKNLTAYVAAAGAAGVALLASTPSAEAKVIYTQTYTRLAAGNLTLDINHDGVYDFLIRDEGGCASERNGSNCGGVLELNPSSYTKGHFMGAPGFASALRAGAKIGPTAQFGAGEIIGSDFYRFFSGTITPPTWDGPFANGGKGVRDRYIGLKFNIGSQAHYGWMRISVQIPNPLKPGFNAFITGYAYETEANKGIIAGATTGSEEKSALTPAPLAPQPAGLGILARGADGLAIWRREEETISR